MHSIKKRQVNQSPLSFDEIFELIDSIKDERYLEVLGAILFRMAFMLEHKLDDSGVVRLNIENDVLEFLENKNLELENIPIKVILEMLEIISLNEDVKYYTLGYNPEFKNGTGKRNNLLTYTRLIAVLLKREKFSKFVSSFARPPVGISSISNNTAYEVFPDLS